HRPEHGKRVDAPDGTLRQEFGPEVLGEAHLKKSTLSQIHAAMRDVVMTDSGTGKKARVLGVEVGGKTGTSQVAKMGEDRNRNNRLSLAMRDHAWFIASAPVEAPEIAVACIVQHAGGGGRACAAPAGQQVRAHDFNRTQRR